MMRLAKLSLFAFGLTVTLGGAAPLSADCIDYGNYSRWLSILPQDGDFVRAAIDSPYVYLSYKGLRVLDISDPTQPTILTTVATPYPAWDLTVRGDYAYLASLFTSYLMIYDISDPTAPSLMSTTFTNGRGNKVSLLGNYALAGSTVVEISDPGNPQIIGSAGAIVQSVVGTTGYGYSFTDSTFRVIDLSDPTAPILLGSVSAGLPTSYFAWDVSGSIAAYASINQGVTLVDVSVPMMPEVVGNIPVSAEDLFRSGPLLYIADQDVEVWDVSDPTSPESLGSFAMDSPIESIDIVGSLGVVGGDICPDFYPCATQFGILDMSHPLYLQPAGHITTPGTGVALSGTTAYIVDSGPGLRVVDISDPQTPSILGSVSTPGLGWDVAVNGPYAYVADDASGVQVVDVSVPTTPTIVANAPTVDRAWGIAAFGSHVYVADTDGGFQIVDVSDPMNPMLVGGLPGLAGCIDVAVSGPIAYVITVGSGLFVVDVSDPTMPTVLGSLDPPGSARGVTAQGSLVYIAAFSEGLQIVDAANPAAPVLIGNVHTPASARNVAVSGSFAYVAQDVFGIAVVNVANPTAPFLVGQTMANAHDVAVGDLVCSIPNFDLWPRQCGIVTGVEPPDTSPVAARLLQSRPNPFTGSARRTLIPFSLAHRGQVTLRVFDISGRSVRSLVDEVLEGGDHLVPWDGRDDQGSVAAAGVYFYRLRTPGFEATRKLVRLP